MRFRTHSRWSKLHRMAMADSGCLTSRNEKFQFLSSFYCLTCAPQHYIQYNLHTVWSSSIQLMFEPTVHIIFSDTYEHLDGTLFNLSLQKTAIFAALYLIFFTGRAAIGHIFLSVTRAPHHVCSLGRVPRKGTSWDLVTRKAPIGHLKFSQLWRQVMWHYTTLSPLEGHPVGQLLTSSQMDAYLTALHLLSTRLGLHGITWG